MMAMAMAPPRNQGKPTKLVVGAVGEHPRAAVPGVHGDHRVGQVCGDERGGIPKDRQKVRQDDGHRLSRQVYMYKYTAAARAGERTRHNRKEKGAP